MKTKIFLMLIFVMSITACRKDEPPLPDIKLSKSELRLEVGQSEKISISGGDGQNYSISPSNSEIAEAVIKGNFLEITARKVGIQNFTVNSAGKTAILKLTVKPQPIPNLGTTVGIFSLEGQPLLFYKMTSRTRSGLWLCESGADPYAKRIFLPYYREGEQKILIIAEGFPSAVINTPPEGREFPIIVEKTINGEKTQLKTEKFRLIVEKR